MPRVPGCQIDGRKGTDGPAAECKSNAPGPGAMIERAARVPFRWCRAFLISAVVVVVDGLLREVEGP
jgi:hypothetical protein